VATRVETYSLVYEFDQDDVFALKYFLHFERKPEYFVVNIIAPCCLLVVISLLVSSQIRVRNKKYIMWNVVAP